MVRDKSLAVRFTKANIGLVSLIIGVDIELVPSRYCIVEKVLVGI